MSQKTLLHPILPVIQGRILKNTNNGPSMRSVTISLCNAVYNESQPERYSLKTDQEIGYSIGTLAAQSLTPRRSTPSLPERFKEKTATGRFSRLDHGHRTHCSAVCALQWN